MIDPLPENPYQTLGVGKECNVNDVKKAYRKLVLTCHPDKTGSLPEAMKKEKEDLFHKVQQAHDLLTNPHERQRYDERVQLEELRSELRRDLGRDGPPTPSFKASFSHKQSRSAPNKTPAKSPTTPIFETRGPPIYETRVPKGVFDEDFTGGRYDSPRGSSRKHEDRFPDTPPTNSRRSSGRVPDRVPDETRKPSRRDEDDDFFARKARDKEVKAEQRANFLDRKKTRTKARRFESENKRQAFAETDSDDSEVDRFMGGSSPRDAEFRRRSDEPIRKARGDERTPRRTRSPSSDSTDDGRLKFAKNHIRSNGTRYVDEKETPEKRPSLFKSRSSRTTPPPPPPVPPVPPPIDTDKARRSSARRTASSKTKRNPEIVEPSKDFHDDYTFDLPRRSKKDDGSMPSSPRNISSRAKTFTQDRPGDSVPSIRRTQTAPLASNGAAGRPSRSSNLKYATTPTGDDEDDSDDSSAESPAEPPPTARFTSKKYRVKEDSDSDSDPHKPRIMTVELDDSIPKSAPPRSSRPPVSASAPTAPSGPTYVEAAPRSHRHRSGDVRSPPRRSNTFDLGTSSVNKTPASKSRHHPTSSNDAGAGAPSGRLFGELSNDSTFVSPDVSYSPRYGRDDIQFTEVRRGSADGALPGQRERGDRGDRDKERERSREKERERERERPHRDSHHRGDRERGKDEYAYETPRSARRAADHRPGLSSRGGSYQSVRV